MTLANRITVFRIALSPVFAGLFTCWMFWHDAAWLIALWAVFLVSELSDVADGWVARKRGETSDVGKLLDPFSDVISRLTIFLCLLLVGLAPLWFFLIVLYRELSMTFLRTLMMQKGVVQAASPGGKLKAWLYFFASLAGLAVITFPQWTGPSRDWVTLALYIIAGAQSVISFLQYYAGYRRLVRKP
jgi:CDP-diacylglycerol--glycerol-3-phosphate 3-phosphatidyltransferase